MDVEIEELKAVLRDKISEKEFSKFTDADLAKLATNGFTDTESFEAAKQDMLIVALKTFLPEPYGIGGSVPHNIGGSLIKCLDAAWDDVIGVSWDRFPPLESFKSDFPGCSGKVSTIRNRQICYGTDWRMLPTRPRQLRIMFGLLKPSIACC
ncbi:uncharacterized protein LOC9651598 [Selaginella moellendorffii]|uniref:uncharacterized protein LOC9651598 n=1 Tax=Selaginella moellendorffii TaxID=88036 RepID=UPI000D1CD6A7|nr:uncharacterized protein LOC9651598 [Selaginella moellendorffii]|eukprot:XP_024521691.1 uncharacterized protein LOC9651598 [Selaginella moellendorffii]